MDSGAGGPNCLPDVLGKDPSAAGKLLDYVYNDARTITRRQDAAQEAVVRALQASYHDTVDRGRGGLTAL